MELRPYQTDIVNRMRKAYQQGFKSPCLVLPCGGGKSIIMADISKLSAQKGNRILVLVHRIELCEQLQETFINWGCDMSKVDIMMVQTASRRLNKLPDYTFILTDESHHSPSNTYQKIYNYFNKAKRIGLTATPAHNEKGISVAHDKLIVGVSVQWLIDNKYLSPFRYYAPVQADFKSSKKKGKDFDQQEAATILDKPKIFGNVVTHYQELANGLKAICYCPTLDYSRKMAEIFNQSGIKAKHMDGETDEVTRKQIMQDFRNGTICIICNVDLISEGLSVDDCNCCILLRPTQSIILHVQQSMRSMRYQPNKTAIIIDHVGNYLRHGLPSDVREWELTEQQKKNMEKATNCVRQCEKCYFTYRSTQTICPECGHINARTKEEIKQIEQVRLQEITESNRAKSIERIKNKDIKECKSLQDFQAWAKLNNKSSRWAYMQWKGKIEGWANKKPKSKTT